MKRAFLLLLPAVLLVFVTIAGCNDETEPRFSRMRVYPECGVVPLQVECMAFVTGGNETGDPTGGNNNLTVSWDFDDETPNVNTSIAYHTFDDPGEFTVVVTAEDPDGKVTTTSQLVRVMPDTLTIVPSSNFPGGAITTNDTVRFDLTALACEVDPDIEDDYRNLIFHWGMDDFYPVIDVITPGNPPDTTYVFLEYQFSNRRPAWLFSDPGTYDVSVSVTFPALATTRLDTLHFEVTDP